MGGMRKSRLSRYNQGRLIEHFVAGTTARTAASLSSVDRKTAAFYFQRCSEGPFRAILEGMRVAF